MPDDASPDDVDSVGPDPDPAPATDLLDDLVRAVTRQQASLDRLTERVVAADNRQRAAADVPLLVELLALRGDAERCAGTAESDRERAGFTALAEGVTRLIAGRGGSVVAPAPGTDFSAATMEAAEMIDTDDPALDRTVDRVVTDGLRLTESGRSVRPALVVVRRYR